MSRFTLRPSRLKGFDYKAERTYFVTMCTKHRIPVFRTATVARLACDVIMRYSNAGSCYLYAYCLMPDHAHLMLKLSGKYSLETMVAVLKAGIKHEARRFATVEWMRGFHERIKREYEETSEFVKYIKLNPVRAGIVTDVQDYPFAGSPDPWR